MDRTDGRRARPAERGSAHTRAGLRALAAALFLALAGAAPAAAIDVFIRSPRSTDVVFGRVEVRVEVLSAEPVAAVEIRLDGERVGRLTEPPYALAVDVGQDNRPRTFEITAVDITGESATATLTTRAIAVNAEMAVKLQQLYVTVTRDGLRVLDLGRDDFEVSDEGEAQTLVTFERGDVPLTAAILVDTSTSMSGDRIRVALAGAERFVESMRPLDEAMMLLFSDRAVHATPFSADAAQLEAGLDDVQADGGTALNDYLFVALKRLEAQQGRRVVIVLSDGVDVHSFLHMDEVLWAARRSQALIYWIRLGTEGGQSSSWRDSAGHARELAGFQQAVAESGGRVFPISRVAEAEGVFREILAELREQYVLGYYPTRDEDDGNWHRVRLHVRRADVAVRTREGYLDY